MKLLLGALLLFSSVSYACFDRDMKYIENPQNILAELDKNNASFSKCVDKLEAKGVNLREVELWRRNRAEGDDGPVIYTYRIQGKDRDDRTLRLNIDYNLKKKAFVCGEPQHNIPKRGC